jgi:uncharacterized protein
MILEMIPYPTANEFLADTQSILEAHEVENSLVLGLAFLLAQKPDYYGSAPLLKTVVGTDGLHLACLMTPPHNLILASVHPQPGAALRALADELWLSQWDVPGVLGPSALAEGFAQEWRRASGERVIDGMQQRVYQLRNVIFPTPAPGSMRLADAQLKTTLTSWTIEFHREAMDGILSQPDAEQATDRRIANGDIFIWDDGGPVSMAAKTRPTRHGISLSLVYTPPEKRRAGYASALVANLSQSLLDRGYEYCSLFTDLAFPTSNHIYQSIGYQPVCDFTAFKFAAF